MSSIENITPMLELVSSKDKFYFFAKYWEVHYQEEKLKSLIHAVCTEGGRFEMLQEKETAR
jgi:hypothetical protein